MRFPWYPLNCRVSIRFTLHCLATCRSTFSFALCWCVRLEPRSARSVIQPNNLAETGLSVRVWPSVNARVAVCPESIRESSVFFSLLKAIVMAYPVRSCFCDCVRPCYRVFILDMWRLKRTYNLSSRSCRCQSLAIINVVDACHSKQSYVAALCLMVII